jgi:hypothetical protein
MDAEPGGPDTATPVNIVPTSRGGARLDENNTAVACLECHSLRGDALWPSDVKVIVWMTAEALRMRDLGDE